MSVGDQSHVLAALFPGMKQYLLYRRKIGTQGLSGRVRIILLPSGFDPLTVQPIAGHYPDFAI
jgi:hypothetical protein